MNYEIQVQQVAPQLLVSMQGRANHQNIGEVIGTLLNQVWEFIAATATPHLGINVAIYQCEADEPPLFFTAEGVPVEVGVLVSAPFASSEPVLCSATPGGTVARTLHSGPYQQLPEAHAAICQWSRTNGYALAGPNWEVYGHMADNPHELRTEVFYLLK